MGKKEGLIIFILIEIIINEKNIYFIFFEDNVWTAFLQI
jgi:hypothetical protein